jgi:hypothetical protein
LIIIDFIGNTLTEINQPYRFYSEKQWDGLFARLDLKTEDVLRRFVSYNALVDAIFGRNLHFVAKLACPPWSPAHAFGFEAMPESPSLRKTA